MGNLTLNISDYELKCHCGKCDVYIQGHEPVIQVVQDCCDHFARIHGVYKVRLAITSAARCYTYNRLPVDNGGPGSNDNSQHPRCCAMDIKIFIGGRQIEPCKVYNYFHGAYPEKYGIGSYDTFTHIDTTPVKRRW